jgi:hypothetical protein
MLSQLCAQVRALCAEIAEETEAARPGGYGRPSRLTT